VSLLVEPPHAVVALVAVGGFGRSLEPTRLALPALVYLTPNHELVRVQCRTVFLVRKVEEKLSLNACVA
jgi:hypothetical protein